MKFYRVVISQFSKRRGEVIIKLMVVTHSCQSHTHTQYKQQRRKCTIENCHYQHCIAHYLWPRLVVYTFQLRFLSRVARTVVSTSLHIFLSRLIYSQSVLNFIANSITFLWRLRTVLDFLREMSTIVRFKANFF